ncbi:hypothetical protein CISIN_1g0464732mg, partial [Citrus sinensis]
RQASSIFCGYVKI